MNLPNLLTLLRMALVPVFYIVFLADLPNSDVWGALIFIVASLTDFLDGYLARKYHLITNFGKIMDPLADKILVLTALICLIVVGRAPAWAVVIILARELAITGLRAVAAAEGIVIAASYWGKFKTVFQMISIILLLLNFQLGLYLLYVAVILTIVSGIEYIRGLNGKIKWM